MRLTNALKDEIVHGIIVDAGNNTHEIEERLKQAVVEAVLEHTPQCIRDVPNEHSMWLNSNTMFLYIPVSLNGTSDVIRFRVNGLYFPYGELDTKITTAAKENAKVQRIAQELHEERARVNSVKAAAQEAVANVTTVKRFCEQFPELAKYAPETPGNTAMQTNVMQTLREAGWPKEKQNGEAKA